MWVILFDYLSVSFISFFLIDYFNDKTESWIGLGIVPITFLGILWEIYITAKELKKYEKNPDPEISEFGNIFCNYFGVTVGNLIIIPGYFFGMVLSYHELQRMV